MNPCPCTGQVSNKRTLFLSKRVLLLFLAAQTILLPGNGQGTITLQVQNSPLDKVFTELQRQSGTPIWYERSTLEHTHAVSFHLSRVSLTEALDTVCRDQPVTYRVAGSMIVIQARPVQLQAVPDPAITGLVLNEKDEPLAGATIELLGTGRKGQTNLSGEFSFPAVVLPARLRITSVGYQPQVVFFEKGGHQIIRLSMAVSKLDEVQVIAYGTTTKRMNTGSVSTLQAAEIGKQPVSNPLAALEGRMPGVEIQQNTGAPGGSFNLRIRGQNSLRNELLDNGNLPLFVVDGVPISSASLTSIYTSGSNLQYGSPLSAFNPSDIESIDILKDADATAIYGSRGANGVVLITTKKGKAGTTKTDLNVYTGYGQVPKFLPLLNTQQYLNMRHEAKSNDGAPVYFYDYDLNGAWDSTRNTNWQKTLIGGTAAITSLQATFSGGNAHTQFLAGGGFMRETTVTPGNFGDKKASGHLHLDHSSEDRRFKMALSVNYLEDWNNLFPEDLTRQAMTLEPDAPKLFGSNGELNWQQNTWTNPFSAVVRRYSGQTSNLVSSANFSYSIRSWLDFRLNLGYSAVSVRELSTVPIASLNPAYPGQGSALSATSSFRSWIAEPQLAFQQTTGKVHTKILAGLTLQQNTGEDQTLQATGFANDALLSDLQAASTVTVISANNSVYKYMGAFMRISFDWQERFLLNLNGRRDGSSRFGQDRRFADFGSVGAAWIFSRESSLAALLPALSFGKLRTSYGITGSDQIGDYGYLDSYIPTAYPYQTGGLIPARLANPDYAWETNRKLDIGLDLGFWKDRLLFDLTWFRNRSSNQLVGYSLAAITGFSSVQANLPALVQNTGWELEFTAKPVMGSRFNWETSFNLTIPSNKLLAYPDIAASSYAYTYQVGKPLYQKSLFHATGVDPQTGVYQFLDVDKNNSVDYPSDLQFFKKVERQYYGGWNNAFSWKDFHLSFLFQFVKQTGYSYFQNFGRPGMRGNQPLYVLDRWQKPGDLTSIEAFTSAPGPAFFAYTNAFSSDKIIEDASYIRLKNISFSYGLPEKLLRRMKIRQVRIYLQAQNLFTVTHYRGLDPENQNSAVLPPLRVLTAGIQFTL